MHEPFWPWADAGNGYGRSCLVWRLMSRTPETSARRSVCPTPKHGPSAEDPPNQTRREVTQMPDPRIAMLHELAEAAVEAAAINTAPDCLDRAGRQFG